MKFGEASSDISNGILKKIDKEWFVITPLKNDPLPISIKDFWVDPRFDGYPVEFLIILMYRNNNFDWSEEIPTNQITETVMARHFAKIFYPAYPDCVCNCGNKSECDRKNCFTHEYHEEITGHKTLIEMEAYDKGRDDEQTTITNWIEDWDGSSNSGFGQLLKQKYKEFSINK